MDPDEDPLEGTSTSFLFDPSPTSWSSSPLTRAEINSDAREIQATFEEAEEEEEEIPSAPPVLKRKPVDIMSLDPMFPSRLRKSPASLFHLAENRLVRTISRFIKSDLFEPFHTRVRRYFHRFLLPGLQTRLIERLIPMSDNWSYPCVKARERIACRAHSECRLVYKRCDKILKLLFTSNIHHLGIDLRKVRVIEYKTVLLEINDVFRESICPKLTQLNLCGGTVHSDGLLGHVEELCSHLIKAAPTLDSLHVPICSNVALRSISDMPGLKSFKTDRTRCFNRRGLWHLCHPKSKSRYQLETLHFGVFKHHLFNKVDASKFFRCMKNLKAFSLLDEDRALTKIGNLYGNGYGDKVLTYSVIRLAIIDSMLNVTDDQAEKPGGTFRCGLREIKIVDRQLKPKYLLETCPDLRKLYIDWQEELSLPPFNYYSVSWFSEMLHDPQWVQLCQGLQDLEVVFPSSYSPNNYSLPLSDISRLLLHGTNLRRLRLEGAGKESPLPLILILLHCPTLEELYLEKTSIHVPDNYEVINQRCVSRSVKIFHFLGDMSSLLMNDFVTTGISHYLPELVELEIQPEAVLGFVGLTPAQMRELTRLKNLRKLSMPLSLKACIMNMPEIIYVLREFSCLRFLVLSWAKWCNSYDINHAKISYLMHWLFNALGAENANIHLQLSYKMHPQMFSNLISR